jgi:hypothetical protein
MQSPHQTSSSRQKKWCVQEGKRRKEILMKVDVEFGSLRKVKNAFTTARTEDMLKRSCCAW